MPSFVQRWRGPISVVGIGIKSAARQLDSATPRVISGATTGGIPSEVLPAGSLYLVTDATEGLPCMWYRTSTEWVPIAGIPGPPP